MNSNAMHFLLRFSLHPSVTGLRNYNRIHSLVSTFPESLTKDRVFRYFLRTCNATHAFGVVQALKKKSHQRLLLSQKDKVQITLVPSL